MIKIYEVKKLIEDVVLVSFVVVLECTHDLTLKTKRSNESVAATEF